MSTLALRAEGLGKQYQIGGLQTGYRTFREVLSDSIRSPFRFMRSAFRKRDHNGGPTKIWALKDVSFEIRQGDVIGVIGRNGAGKSTLLKVLSRITEPTEGYADITGRVGSLLEVGTGFHPELTGRENVFLNGAIIGMTRAEIQHHFDAIVAFAEVEKFIDTPVKHYSSGMYLRLAFAIAAHLEPEILLVDEVLAVGDLAFQKKCLGKMGEVAHQGRTVLFVSHNMGAVRSLCEKGLVLDRGTVVEYVSIGKAIETYYKLSSEKTRKEAEKLSHLDRTGFGPIHLCSHPGTTIDQGDAVEVGATLNIGEDVAGFALICLIEDMHQRPVLHLRTESTNLDTDSVHPGLHQIRLKLPPLWLEPGLYSLCFKVLLSGQIARGRYLSDILYLDVGGASSGCGAVLTPKADWVIRPVESTVEALEVREK